MSSFGPFCTSRSGFGGHPIVSYPSSILATPAGAGVSPLDGLADLWISDAEQLIAAASIAFIQPLIARRIGITPQQMEDVLKELQGAIPARRLAEVSKGK